MKILKISMFCLCAITIFTCIQGRAFADDPVCSVYRGPMVEVGGVRFPDSDDDGIRDVDSNTDANCDGIPDGNPVDNCPYARNGNCGGDADPLNCDIDEINGASDLELSAGNQADWNGNGIGDACDDVDSDGAADYIDNCRNTPNPDQDPGVCTDTDGDRFEDPIDNCPAIYNPDQRDTDEDGKGEWCDTCPYVYNPDQDRSACPSGTAPAIPPSESETHTQPAGGSGAVAAPDFARGSGGCSVTGAGSSSAWAIMIILSTLGIASARIRRIIF